MKKAFPSSIALGTHGCFYRVQGRIFKPINSIPSNLPSLFGGTIKLAGAQTLLLGLSNILAVSPKPLNIPAATPAGQETPSRVYLNKEIQEIIRTVMEARSATVKGPRKRLLKARFPNIYGSDNHLVCYNFYEQYKDYFATAGAKESNCILFVAFFP